MKNNKKIVSMILVFVLMLSTFTTVLAADRDLVHKETKEKKVFEEYLLDDSFIYELLVEGALEDYYVEVNEKLYNSAEVQEKFDEDPTVTLEEAVVGLDSVEEPTEELEVVKASAIDKTVKLNVAALEPAEGAKAKVVIFKLDDKGEKATTLKTVAAAEIEENVVTVDLSAETVGDADYAFVVTVGENEAEVIETLAFKAVEDLVAKIKTATTAQLATLLADETYFTGFDVAKVDAYKTNVTNEAANLYTVADVQELVIDAVAANAEFDAFVAELTDAEVTSEYAKYLVLKGQFSNVLDANMDAYMATTGPIFNGDLVTLDGAMTDFDAISDAIDQINLDAVVTNDGVTVDGDAKPSELNAYKAALETLELVNEETEDTVGSLTKEEIIEAIDNQLKAIAEAREAADAVIVEAETAMAAFEAAFGEDFDEETEYTDVVAAIEALVAEDLSENALATTTLEGKVDALEAATEEITIVNDTLAALAAFAAAFGEDAELETVYTDVTDNFEDFDAEDYSYASGKTITTLKAALTALEAETAEWETYNAVMAAKTAEEMRALLFEFEDPNYVNLTSAQKLEFAGMFIEAIVDADDADKEDYSDIATLLGTEVTTNYATLIDSVNDATSISAMIAALEAISADYDALGAQAKADIAEALLEEVPFATMAEIEAAMGL